MMMERDTCREQLKRLWTGIQGKLSLYVWAKEGFPVERTLRLGEGTGWEGDPKSGGRKTGRFKEVEKEDK